MSCITLSPTATECIPLSVSEGLPCIPLKPESVVQLLCFKDEAFSVGSFIGEELA